MKLSPRQIKILNTICRIQIDSITRIYQNSEELVADLRDEEYDVDEMDIADKLADRVIEFENIKEGTLKISKASPEAIGMMIHILFNYFKQDSIAVKGLYRKLFKIQDKYIKS